MNITNTVSAGYTPFEALTQALTVCRVPDVSHLVPVVLIELEGETNLVIPGRWTIGRTQDAKQELQRLAAVFVEGTTALTGLYMRICDTIRRSNLSDAEIRATLTHHLPPARISELLRVAYAPDEVYRRYSTGFFGFKAALRECRGYQVTPSEELRRRKLRRTAARLVQLAGGPAQITLKTRTIIIQ